MIDSKYAEIIYSCGLYPNDFILRFGENSSHWLTESNRHRELSLRHDLCCAYLCNMQKFGIDDFLKALKDNPRKRPLAGDSEENKRKRMKLDDPNLDIEAIPCSSKDCSSLETGSSTTMSNKTLKELFGETTIRFRFILLEGMPNARILQNYFCTKWGIVVDKMWDIIDLQEQKLIEVKVSQSANCNRNYLVDRIGIESRVAFVQIDSLTGNATISDHPGDFNGLTKVKEFIVRRAAALKSKGLINDETSDSKDLEKILFSSEKFNKEVEQWVNDFWPKGYLEDNPLKDIQILSDLTEILSKDLLDNMTNLDEAERTEFVKWRGKLTPEIYVHNIKKTNENKDEDLVRSFIDFIVLNSFVKVNMSEVFCEGFLEGIIKEMSGRDFDPFHVNFDNSLLYENLKELLGVGKKQRRHNPYDETTIQPEYTGMQKRKYDSYFDHIMMNMSQNCDNSSTILKSNGDPIKVYPLIVLKRDLVESNHRIAGISALSCERIINNICKTYSGIYTSKITNFYSRLGGAYLLRSKKYEGENSFFNRNNIACFPIYSSMYKHMNYKEPDERWISGICFRGPQHARSSTDKINIITLEILNKDKFTVDFIRKNNMKNVYMSEKYLLLIRQNSIMKEDCNFNTFCQNSMFLPANLLGLVTFERADLLADENMNMVVNRMLRDHGIWFTERYTEGLIMSCIGTSRDEGYFALSRKLFMIILQMKRTHATMNWDIKEFCAKINETLIDNPFSMHFHKTFIKILNHYRGLGQ